MAKQSGLGDLCYISGVDISTDVASLDEISGGPQIIDTTTITQNAPSRAGTVFDGHINLTAFLDNTVAHPVLSALPTSDAILTYLRGATAQTSAAGLVARQVDYAGTRSPDGNLTFTVQALADASGIEWGKDYVGSPSRTDTSATNGTGVDDGALTSFGFTAYLQVFAFTGTSATVTVQHSADNGVSDPYTTLLSFVPVAAAPTAQRVTVTGVAKRWIRVVTTGAFSNFVFHVMGLRVFGVEVAGGVAVDVQIFTTSGTWTQPVGVTSVAVWAVGGGGGGGAGARQPSGTPTCGAGGGAGGCVCFGVFAASVLAATETVTVGAGGAGRAANTTDSSSGLNGTAGGVTRFGTAPFRKLSASPGNGGTGGNTAGITTGATTAGGMVNGGVGGIATLGSTGGQPTAAAGGGAGGGGGGIDATPTAKNGAGGASGQQVGTTSAFGAAGGSNGGAGTDAAANAPVGGCGGGGGGSNIAGAGGNGGNGGLYGGGGGGGGSALNGSNGGAGGNGAAGLVVAISW